ncbi:hypothetical protein [Magnetovibrio sp.]|uniref:hypothetical protein n=1 Tax=Magnetovibrio sp. TaxID=2024836 RepID=UPI002F95426A
MKILKIENGQGFFKYSESAGWEAIDQIDKDGLMGLLNCYLENAVEMDEFDESNLSHQAQQIIYKSVYEKFKTLDDNKEKFKDESERQYLTAIQKYQST